MRVYYLWEHIPEKYSLQMIMSDRDSPVALVNVMTKSNPNILQLIFPDSCISLNARIISIQSSLWNYLTTCKTTFILWLSLALYIPVWEALSQWLSFKATPQSLMPQTVAAPPDGLDLTLLQSCQARGLPWHWTQKGLTAIPSLCHSYLAGRLWMISNWQSGAQWMHDVIYCL